MIVASQIFQPDFKENDAELLGCVLHTIIYYTLFFSDRGGYRQFPYRRREVEEEEGGESGDL